MFGAGFGALVSAPEAVGCQWEYSCVIRASYGGAEAHVHGRVLALQVKDETFPWSLGTNLGNARALCTGSYSPCGLRRRPFLVSVG